MHLSRHFTNLGEHPFLVDKYCICKFLCFNVSSCNGRSDGLYADPANCRQMFWCANGAAFRSACPEGQFFDPEMSSCHPYAAFRCLSPAYSAPASMPSHPVAGPVQPYLLPFSQSPMPVSYSSGRVRRPFLRPGETPALMPYGALAQKRSIAYMPYGVRASAPSWLDYQAEPVGRSKSNMKVLHLSIYRSRSDSLFCLSPFAPECDLLLLKLGQLPVGRRTIRARKPGRLAVLSRVLRLRQPRSGIV